MKWLIAAAALCRLFLGQATSVSAAEPPVICPAITEDERPRAIDHRATEMSIELVVVGQPARAKPVMDGEEKLNEVDVEKVLFGHTSEKRIRVGYRAPLWETRMILALAPRVYGETPSFELKYDITPDEEWSQRMLAAARLDFHVLSAAGIFAGRQLPGPINPPEANAKEADWHDVFRHFVEVESTLAGAPVRAGEKVIVEIKGYVKRAGETPRVRSEPQIYLVQRIEKGRFTGRPIHYVAVRLPMACEADIKQALQRRPAYPIVTTEIDGQPQRVREVLFQGTTAEAIRLLGSASNAAVLLGERKLRHTEPESIHAVAQAIADDLFAQTTVERSNFRRQRQLIRVLGGMRSAAKSEHIERLLGQMLDRLGADPPALAVRADSRDFRALRLRHREAEDETANHSLAWLLAEVPPERVIPRYSDRLLKLRDAALGGWRDEIQLALNANRVEDRIELAAAIERAKNAQPARSPAGPWGKGHYHVAFSPNGKLFAVAGVNVLRVWNTGDWSLVAEHSGMGTICGAAFSNDGESLLVIGVEPRHRYFRRFDWRSGRVVHEFSGPEWGANQMELSADQTILATASYYGPCQHVFDVARGTALRSYLVDDVDISVEICLRPDGKLLLRKTAKGEWAAETIPAGKVIRRKLGFAPATFAPDGSVLYAFEDADADRFNRSRRMASNLGELPAAGRIQARAPDGDFRLLASSAEATRAYAAVVSRDGKRMAALGFREAPEGERDGEPRRTIEIYALPELRRTAICDLPPECLIVSLAISPDGRIVATYGGDSPRLFDAATGHRLVVGEGQQGTVREIAFDTDGRALRSFDDQFICAWDAATMRLTKLASGPAETKFLAARPGDGAFAAYWTHASQRRRVRFVDARSGSPTCEIELPEKWEPWSSRRLYWLNDQEALWCGERRWRRFNYRTGATVAEGDCDEKGVDAPRDRSGEPTEDGKSLLHVVGKAHDRRWEATKVDLATMRSARWGAIELERCPNGRFGLIPGGKYFHLGTQIYDRATLKLVGEKELGPVEGIEVTVSPDGSRLAFVTEVPGEAVSGDQRWNPILHGVVRIAEVPSCKTLFAFRLSQPVTRLAFSPDGSRLAVVNDDNTIEVRSLPPAPAQGDTR